jgi:murein DD-endopeptidase MepM/ murein hydrolase activator NlpD
MKFVDGQLRAFGSNGTSNEDFFGFGMPVLSPIAGVVSQVKPPNGVNLLGQMGTTEVGFIAIKSDDGATLIMAHLAKISVTPGDRVRVGDPIGTISNNGYCRHPHIHLGAYRAGRSLIIEFDRDQLDATFLKYRDSELAKYR